MAAEACVVTGPTGVTPGGGGFARASSLTFGQSVVNLILGILISALTARLLGPRGRGIFVLALLLPNLIALLSDAGMSSSAVYLAAQRRYRASLLAGNNLLIGGLLALLGMAVGAALLAVAGEGLFPEVPVHFVLVALLTLPALDIAPLLQNLLLGQQRFMAYNVAAVAATALPALPVLAALVTLQSPFSVILAQVVGSSVFVVGLGLWLRRDLGALEVRPCWPYWRESLSYGVKAHIGTVMSYVNLRADSWLIGAILSPAAVGIYSVGVTVMERIWLLPNAVGQVLFPRVAADRQDEGSDVTPLVLRSVLVLAGALSAGLALVAPLLVRAVFSARFLPVVPSMRFLALGVVALAGSNVLMSDLSGRGRPEIAGYAGALGATANIALNLVWLPRHGITGAGMASAVSYGMTFLLCLVMYCRVSGSAVGTVLVPRGSDVATLGAALRRLRTRKVDPPFP